MKRHLLSFLALVCLGLTALLAGLWINPQGQLRNTHWRAPAPLATNYQEMLPLLPEPAGGGPVLPVTRPRRARSLESEAKKVPGLYFIGEVVDVTGHLGGYNFQWAWSSGWAAGQVA